MRALACGLLPAVLKAEGMGLFTLPPAIVDRLAPLWRWVTGPVTRVVAGLWFILGVYDLVLSEILPPSLADRLPKAYAAAGMLSGLTSWHVWIIGFLVIVIAGMVEYLARRTSTERRAEANRKAAISARPVYPPDAPVSIMAARAERFVDGFARALTESPKPKPSTPPMSLDLEPEWDKLYSLNEDATDLRLLFLPDGEDVEGYALLLVLHGYKVRLGLDQVPQRRAVDEALRALRESPNASFAARTAPFLVSLRALEPESVGRRAFERGEIERIGLSTGGQLRITELGKNRADNLARDLIRRA